ncbi:MAG: RNA 2'-phosphotransferase [Chloroflexota bacterium]
MTTHTRLSKFISMVLRHRADEFGVNLDNEGYTDIGELYAVVQKRYNDAYSYDDLIRVVTTPGSDNKMRFELTGYRVRARYGHNRRVQSVEYEPATPPEILYHGTVANALESIRDEGLTAQQRQYVHLSTTTERATSVGSRRGKPILLTVRAKEAADNGVVFFHPEDEHYLAEHIPVDYIDFPE